MMKKLTAFTALLFCCLMICFAAVADLTGKWTGSLKTANGDYPLSFTFKVDGDVLTGTADSKEGSTPIKNGKINGQDFSFGLDYNNVELKNSGKYYGDSITIDIDYNGTLLHGKLKRDK